MHIIFLVHGMGTFATGWSNPVQEQIKKLYDPAAYAFLADAPFGSTFKFVEITYDDVMVEYLAEAKKRADQLGSWNALLAPLDGAFLDLIRGVVKVASTGPSDKFLVTHIADVAFYLATDLGELVVNRIAAKIASTLNAELKEPSDRWSIIGHSLGTRVVTDVLQQGFTATPSLIDFGKAKAITMVSNVSRLLESLSKWSTVTGDVYRSRVYPSKNPSNGVCEHFINCTHRLDPFAFPREFDPPATFGDQRCFLDNVYHPVKLALTDITDKNVHAISHYLEHPDVHTTLFRYLVPGSGRRGATPKELTDAHAQYREKTITVQISSAWRESLQQLKDEKFDDLAGVVKVWESFRELVGTKI